jgi:predicted dehydrogenase/nucleoside-diphosphate-sugar epimerase
LLKRIPEYSNPEFTHMKIGIIGCGMIVQVHGPVIRAQKDAELVGVADRDEARARAVAAQLGAGRVYGDAAAMIAAEKPDIVHVLTPPATHAEVVIEALERGCHVLVEKPMALLPQDARRMADAARAVGRQLCVNHNLLYETSVARARALVADGRIGQVVSVDAYFSYNVMRNPALTEDGAELCHWAYRLNGGPLQDQMPHMAALAFEYLPEFRGVQVRQHRRGGALPAPWPDDVRVLIDGGSVSATIAINFGEKPDLILYTIRGTMGVVQANLFNGIVTLQRQSRLPRAAARGLSGFQLGWQNVRGATANAWSFVTGKVDKSSGIVGVVSRFYATVREGKDAPVDVEKAVRTVEFMDRVWPEPVVPRASGAAISVAAGPAPTALVTGASGFLGSHLVKRLLADGLGVRAVMRPNSIHAGRMQRLGVETVTADLAQPATLAAAMRGIRTVYHAAAPMNNDWHEHEEITIRGTQNLVAAAREAKVDRLLFVSTLAVYDLLSLPDHALVREDTPYQANSRQMGPYAHCKIEAEKLLLQAHRETGLPVTIVRPGIIIGPTGRVFFPHLGMKNGDTLFIVIGSGDNVLPLTCVENTVDGMVRAATSPKAVGQIYNLVDDAMVTINAYLRAFVAETGIPAKLVHVPYVLPYLAFGGYELAAAIGILPKGKTSRRQLRWKTKPVRFDRSKAAQELEWATTLPVAEGMRRTFGWYVSKFGRER